jgi:endonuclease VIII-like 1
MPEISEVRIMSEFINEKSEGLVFTKIEKNPVHKSKTVLDVPYQSFTIHATSKGKELQLVLSSGSGKKKMTLTMGMSGNWNFTLPGEKIPKHTHLMFHSLDGILGLNDVRRFARWEWRDWNIERGPDPSREFPEFRENVLKGISERKRIFEKPIYEVLMDQEYFNGVGNYLRAEILGRIDLDPKMSARSYLELANDTFFDVLKKTIDESYILGGGQFKDWYNEMDRKGEKWESFQEWMRFYFNKETCFPLKDKKDRVFWINKKWL